MTQRVSIVAVNECSGSALMGAVDTFYSANVIWQMLTATDEMLFTTQVVSPDAQPVTCANGYPFNVDGGLDLVSDNDGIVCIPFSASSEERFLGALKKQARLVEWIKTHGNNFKFLAGISVAVFLPAEAGLLENKSAATAWWFAPVFKKRYPTVQVSEESVCVIDGNILSTGSMNGHQDICMEIVEKIGGKNFAVTMSRYMMTDYERRSAVPENYASQIHSSNPVVNQADAWIQRNLGKEIRVDDVAVHVSVSSRTLTRYFQSTFEMTPQQYIQKSRVQKGKLLLEITKLDLAEIADRCGYSDPSTFRRVFKKYSELSPMAYREQYLTNHNR